MVFTLVNNVSVKWNFEKFYDIQIQKCLVDALLARPSMYELNADLIVLLIQILDFVLNIAVMKRNSFLNAIMETISKVMRQKILQI